MIDTVPSLLIVDDEPGLRLALHANFLRRGWQVETAGGLQEAHAKLRRRAFDLVLSDVRMGDGDGFAVLEAVREAAPEAAFLFLTAYGSVPEAVRAMQGGAVDYLTKPVSFDHLLSVATGILNRRPARAPAQAPVERGGLMGRSRALQLALARAQAAADSEAEVLLEAEDGTETEMLARLIHDSSARRSKPFLTLNCASPEAVLERELFAGLPGGSGHGLAAKPGRLVAAKGGTLLLEEIGEMPLRLQARLLQALRPQITWGAEESRLPRSQARVIAATPAPLSGLVERGVFRSGLHHRLNMLPLRLPPLRERREDLPLLAEHFAKAFAARTGRRAVRLHASFLSRLEAYSWPGNVRELADLMHRVLALPGEAELTAAAFDQEHRPGRTVHAKGLPGGERAETAQQKGLLSMDEVERTHLERTLASVGGNRTRAAELLGISVRTMRNKIRQYDLPPRRYA